MANDGRPSRFGVKFWLASATLLSVLSLLDVLIMTAQAKASHADFWLLHGVARFMAVVIVWGAYIQSYRRIRNAAVETGAPEGLLLTIRYWSASALAITCAGIMWLITNR